MKRNPTGAVKAAPRTQKHAQAWALAADPCESVTSAAIQAVIDKIIESWFKAESDAIAHPATDIAGVAAPYNLQYLTLARDTMLTLQAWLQIANVIDPPPFVTNANGAYNVHSYVRETVVYLHHARHWCAVSAAFHPGPDAADARDSFELTTQALELIEPLGAEAGRCYMDAFGPFS